MLDGAGEWHRFYQEERASTQLSTAPPTEEIRTVAMTTKHGGQYNQVKVRYNTILDNNTDHRSLWLDTVTRYGHSQCHASHVYSPVYSHIVTEYIMRIIQWSRT